MWYATCRSGPGANPHFRTEYVATKQAAEDQMRMHEHDVQVARTGLRQRNPSLLDQYEHYVKMSEDPHVSEMDRHMWKMLAQEAGKRLGLGTTNSEDQPLF